MTLAPLALLLMIMRHGAPIQWVERSAVYETLSRSTFVTPPRG